jgi:putative FmdB family regulatory protein
MIFKEYDCPECGEIELRHSINETVEKCPFCDSKITKQMGGGSFILKGRGYYSTDNRNRTTAERKRSVV